MNATVDRLCLLNTELKFEPFHWFAVLFGVIAAAFSVTKRNYIAWDSTWTISTGERNPMVGGYGMPKTRGTPTGGTTAIEIVQSELPISISEVNGQSGNSGRASLPDSQPLLWIVPLPSKRLLENMIAMTLIVASISLLFNLNILPNQDAPTVFPLFALLIGFYFPLDGIAITEIVFVRVLAIARFVSLSPTALLCLITRFALSTKAVFVATVASEVFVCCWQEFFTYRAFFKSVHGSNYSKITPILACQVAAI